MATHADLADAERHVSRAREFVDLLRSVIAELEMHGRCTETIKRWLDVFEAGLKMHRERRDAIAEALRSDPDPPAMQEPSQPPPDQP